MVSQQDGYQTELAPAVDDDWHIIPADWWRTPIWLASWSYEPEEPIRGLARTRPPCYCLPLNTGQEQDLQDSKKATLQAGYEWPPTSAGHRFAEEEDDGGLNEQLVGVQCANDAIRCYEVAVGIDYLTTDVESDKQSLIRDPVSETDIESGKERWDDLVRGLFGATLLQDLLKGAKAKAKVLRALPREQLVLPNAGTDYFSQPSTPKPFRLNPSASSFVPLGSPTTTPSASSSSPSTDFSDRLNSFSFPSFYNAFPSKVYQEHVNNLPSRSRTSSSGSSSVESIDQSSNDILPLCLFEPINQRRRPVRLSRTRAIVDQLRSQYNHDGAWTTPGSRVQDTTPASDPGVGNQNQFNKLRSTVSDTSTICPTTPPLSEEDHQVNNTVSVAGWGDGVEGWTIPPATVSVDPETKRSRSKELLMTLRRRTDSLTSNGATAASLSAARSLDVTMSPVTYESETLVESPGSMEVPPIEFQVKSGRGHGKSPSDSKLHHESRSTHMRDSFSSHSDLTSTIPFHQTAPQPTLAYAPAYSRSRRDSRTHTWHQSYSQTCSLPTSYPAGYYQNAGAAMPYALLGYPVSMSGISVATPLAVPTIPVTVAVGNPGVGMRASVPVPVPVQTLQYSTLMHLRIMQQMQVMRNSMSVNGGMDV
jgi:hypothetical protein